MYIKGVEKHIKASHIENLNCINPNFKGKFNYFQCYIFCILPSLQLSLEISSISKFIA